MATSIPARSGSDSLVLRGRNWVAPLCWFAVLLDGFDAVVLGAIMPMLTSDASMGIDNGTGTVIDLEGSIILPPGGYACWVTPAQASVAGMWFSFNWIEVPIAG